MTIKIKVVTISESQKDECEKRRLAFMVPDPWNDPFCAKNGLAKMYIESTIAEILYLRAESEPGVKLNCPNPVYGTYHKLLGACLGKKLTKDEITKAFMELVKFLGEKVLDTDGIEIVKWNPDGPAGNYIPDIRLIDTIGEALGCLSNYIGIDL